MSIETFDHSTQTKMFIVVFSHAPPSCYDLVLCARGKLAFDHEGNRRFRALVKQNQKQYSAAGCKYEKSKIVSFIVAAVRNASPMGGFVKNIDGAWYEVGDRHAKEKVGQTFRGKRRTHERKQKPSWAATITTWKSIFVFVFLIAMYD